jgi:hypothetical protein
VTQQENFYAKSLTLDGLNGTAAQNFVNYYFDVANNQNDRFWFYQLDMHGGKFSQISQVGPQDTAYVHRNQLFIIQFYDRFENFEKYPANGGDFLDGWVQTIIDPLDVSSWGAYANYADPKLPRTMAEEQYYGSNLARLRSIKAKYDPDDLFFYPQSVQPISAS